MRTNFKFALMAAAAALSMGFVSCSSDEVAPEEANPNYNPETHEVTTNFVFNVSTSNVPTRMTEANTQATLAQNFRGIDNATLMSYKLGTANDGKYVTSATAADKVYGLGTLLTAGAIDPDGGGASVPESRRVIELALPTESNALLFWGKAVKNGTSNQQGEVEWTVNKNIANNAFTLARRIPAGDGELGETAYKEYQALIAGALTKIVKTSVDYDVTFGGSSKSGTLAWADFVTVAGTTISAKSISPVDGVSPISPLGEIMADAFKQLNTIYPNEVRAGSGPTVAKMLTDLYNVIHNVAQTPATSLQEAVVKAVADGIETNINTCIDPSSSTWRTTTSIKTWTGLTASTTRVTGDLNQYPRNFNVPNGAASLQYDVATNTYTYRNDLPTYSMSGAPGGSFNIFNYRYPAELCYFGNSPIRVTNDSHVTADYPDGVANWDNDASWAAGATGTGSLAWTKNGHVLSSTRSVAMQENINYGSALFKSTVRYGVATLKDNNAAIQLARTGATEADASIPAVAGAFTLTGILIGGQEETMGWNYVSKSATPTFSSFIYDSDIPNTAIPAYSAGGAKTEPNYTLVWDNWNPVNVGTKQNVVYVALEFVNNTGRDFWGMNNLIRNGATFYITGKLDPDESSAATLAALGKTAVEYAADKSLGVTWPTKYALPPYNGSGTTIQERRVFMQDFMTEANFVLGENSLKYALVAVPDLRSTQISLGLSVDLSWSTGLVFEDIVLGN